MPNKIQRQIPQVENTLEPRGSTGHFNARLPIVERRVSKVSFNNILTQTFNNCISITLYSWQLKLKTTQLTLKGALK